MDLLARIEAFCPERGITEVTFGRLAVNDSKFVRRLRARERMLFETVEKAERFIIAETERMAAKVQQKADGGSRTEVSARNDRPRPKRRDDSKDAA